MRRVLDLPITTDDGRNLLLQEAGDPSGTPVLFHSGTPNSRLGSRPMFRASSPD
jgi:hypothetical protein